MHRLYASCRIQRADFPTAVTIGNFDGIHRGHRALLSRLVETARRENLAATLLTFEPHPRSFFDPTSPLPRLTSLREKCCRIIESGVDGIVVERFDGSFARLTAARFLETVLIGQLNAKRLVVGDDFRLGRDQADLTALIEVASSRNIPVDVVEGVYIDGKRVSSTAIRQALESGDLAQAKEWLGRDYAVTGIVRSGRKLGRKLGFPTVNVDTGRERLPIAGVFAASLEIDGRRYRAVANVGRRPTVEATGKLLVEAHAIDPFDEEAIGRRPIVRFFRKIRDEKKFDGLQALQSAIAADLIEARAFFEQEGNHR